MDRYPMMEEPMTEDPAAAGDTPPDPLAAAMQYEREIAAEAEDIRGDAKSLTAPLFLKLWPLLKRPIPAGFIVTTEAVKGKPYPSTGVKSLQVFVNRMNDVLTPLWWGWSVDYNEDGTLATVEVWVGESREVALLTRESKGGVNQASTIGNRYKGSETNAAKRAFAAIGVANEVYLGASDFDPDTDTDAAKQQERTDSGEARKLPADAAERLERIVARSHRSEQEVATKLRAFGVKAVGDLTVEQSLALHAWAVEDVTP